MVLTDLLKGAGRVVQAAALGLAVGGCGGSEEKQGCKTDYDCKNDRVCVDGYCEDSHTTGNGGSKKLLYIWPVGNCEPEGCIFAPSGLPDTSPEEAAATYGFTRNFTQSDLRDEEGCYENLDKYQCALANEPSLYVYRGSDGICLNDNLLLMTNRPCPGFEECVSYVLNSPWYKTCFGDGEP